MNILSNLIDQIHDHYVGKAVMITLGTGYGCMAATDVLVTIPNVFGGILDSQFPWNKFFSRTLRITDSFASATHLSRFEPGICITSTPDAFLHAIKKGDDADILPDDLCRIGFLFPFIIARNIIMFPEKPNAKGNDRVEMFLYIRNFGC